MCLAKMKQRCKALAEDDAKPRGGLRELAITSGIVSIFRASAGVVPWTGAELDNISKLWILAFKQAWEFSNSMDGSVIIVDKTDGGRRCPSGREVWTEDVRFPDGDGSVHSAAWWDLGPTLRSFEDSMLLSGMHSA